MNFKHYLIKKIFFLRHVYRNWYHSKYLDRASSPLPKFEGKYSKIFLNHQGLKSQKWLHYLNVYDDLVVEISRQFPKSVGILEIGVQSGGCLQIWRKLFGPDAAVFGVDINPKCGDLELDAKVRIGDICDQEFAAGVIDEMGKVNVIIDDASHNSLQQRIALENLWPHLSENGFYIIEDLEHAYYWSQGGGYLRPSSFIERCKRLVDDINSDFYFSPRLRSIKINTDSLGSISFHKGMVVLQKRTAIKSGIVWSGTL